MVDIELLAALVALGALTGVLAALLGIGGGLVTVAPLAFILPVPAPIQMHCAVGTSLAVAVLTGLSSVRAHHRHGAIDWALVRRLAPALFAGALTGSWLADQVTSQALMLVFAVLVVLIGVLMLNTYRTASAGMLNVPTLNLAGLGIGLCSAVMGIAGGAFTVPLLTWRAVQINRAVAISAACGLPISIAGALGYLLLAQHHSPYTIGYIYWPAFLVLAAGTIATAPLGATLAHRLPRPLLRKAFACFLLIIGAFMVLKAKAY